MDNRERARARNKKQRKPISLPEEKILQLYSGGEKMRNASSYQGENERQNKVNRNTNISSIKRVTRKLKEVSRFKGDVTRNDSERRFLAQHSITILLRIVLNGYNKIAKIATLCCAKNRCCESSRITSPVVMQNNGKEMWKNMCCPCKVVFLLIRKKGCCTCKVFFWQIRSIVVFLSFSLSSLAEFILETNYPSLV